MENIPLSTSCILLRQGGSQRRQSMATIHIYFTASRPFLRGSLHHRSNVELRMCARGVKHFHWRTWYWLVDPGKGGLIMPFSAAGAIHITAWGREPELCL